MVKFNISILNRLKIMGFFVNTRYIHKQNVIFNKTVAKLATILTKNFFSYLNPESYLKFCHGTIIRTGITCKKIPCFMGDLACRWFIVKKAKIF